MKKAEYFAAVQEIAEQEFGVSVLFGDNHCRRTELSDARTCVVVILYYDLGLNMVQIAELTGLSVSGVCYLVNRHQERLKQSFTFKSLFQTIRKRVFSNVLVVSQ